MSLYFWQITYTTTSPEVAFTGDTTSDFIVDDNNSDVLKAKVLIMEVTHVHHLSLLALALHVFPRHAEHLCRKYNVSGECKRLWPHTFI